jgi:hypothetical protein
VLLPDNIRTIVANAIKYQKIMVLGRITNFSVKNSIEEIKKKIFISQIKLSELEIQETLNIAEDLHARITDFYQHLQQIWR